MLPGAGISVAGDTRDGTGEPSREPGGCSHLELALECRPHLTSQRHLMVSAIREEEGTERGCWWRKYAGISIAGIIWKVGGGSPVMPLAFPAFVNSSHPLSGCPTRGGVAQYKLTGSGLWSAPSSESLLGRTRPQCHPHNAASPYLARWRQQVFFPPCECMGSLGQ